MDIAPAQHLWDRTVLRRIEGVPALRPWLTADISEKQRAVSADRVLLALASGVQPRPILFESPDPLRRAGFHGVLAAGESVPFIQIAAIKPPPDASASVLARLERLRHTRQGAAEPRSDRARSAWSRAYSTVGELVLGSETALDALRTAVHLAPMRSVAWTNLGVAWEMRGDVMQAIECTQHALALDPLRATPWLNLARLQIAIGHPAEARRVVELAKHAGAHDPRLDRLARALR